MSKRTEIEVTIDEEGNVVLEAHGHRGKSCLLALDEIVKALGKGSNPKPTSEMYLTPIAESTRQKGSK